MNFFYLVLIHTGYYKTSNIYFCRPSIRYRSASQLRFGFHHLECTYRKSFLTTTKCFHIFFTVTIFGTTKLVSFVKWGNLSILTTMTLAIQDLFELTNRKILFHLRIHVSAIVIKLIEPQQKIDWFADRSGYLLMKLGKLIINSACCWTGRSSSKPIKVSFN